MQSSKMKQSVSAYYDPFRGNTDELSSRIKILYSTFTWNNGNCKAVLCPSPPKADSSFHSPFFVRDLEALRSQIKYSQNLGVLGSSMTVLLKVLKLLSDYSSTFSALRRIACLSKYRYATSLHSEHSKA